MADTDDQVTWTPPDDAAIYEITKAVAADLAEGDSRAEIVEALASNDGWPREAATEFVDAIERERAEHEPPPIEQRDILLTGAVAILLLAGLVGVMFTLGINTVTQVGGGLLWALLVGWWWRWWRRRPRRPTTRH